jgi:hypothetical protein
MRDTDLIPPEGKGEYLLHYDAEDSVRQAQLYTRAPLIVHGSREKGVARQQGAQFIMQAMANEYPRDVVEVAFRNVRDKVHHTAGRVLDEGMTRGDLDLLHEELQYQGLERLNQELQELRSRIPQDSPNDTPEAIKDDLARAWRSPSVVTPAGRWPSNDAEHLMSRCPRAI